MKQVSAEQSPLITLPCFTKVMNDNLHVDKCSRHCPYFYLISNINVALIKENLKEVLRIYENCQNKT